MKCQSCGTENRAQARFCEECGALIKRDDKPLCPACGHKNENTAKFCAECGQTLGALPPAPHRKRRVWLWGLLGMLLALMLCGFGYLLLPQPPEEPAILPAFMHTGWERLVEGREAALSGSGLSGSLLRGLSAILPGRGQAPAKAEGGQPAEDGQQVAPASVNANCRPELFDQAACQAVGGKLMPDWEGAAYCNCPGEKQDEGWCKQAHGSWDPKNKYCSFYNRCNHLEQYGGVENEDWCTKNIEGAVSWGSAKDNPDNPNLWGNKCMCPNPAYTSQACREMAGQVKMIWRPACMNKVCTMRVKFGDSPAPVTSSLIGAKIKTKFGDYVLHKINDHPNDIVFIGSYEHFEKIVADAGNPTVCWGGCCYEMDLKTGMARIFQLWEGDLGAPAVVPQPAALVQPAAKQTCCASVRTRGVKYFRDPPGAGALFLGFDMQCTGADWQLDGQCASFEALIGADRSIPWTSGECCPDPDNPDRLNCSGGIEGQKKSMTKIVMTYGGCTAEAEFQSPYQAPVLSAPAKKKDSGSACPPGQSLCGGVCCSDCYYDPDYKEYSCNDS